MTVGGDAFFGCGWMLDTFHDDHGFKARFGPQSRIGIRAGVRRRMSALELGPPMVSR